jgi:hypothetical protein
LAFRFGSTLDFDVEQRFQSSDTFIHVRCIYELTVTEYRPLGAPTLALTFERHVGLALNEAIRLTSGITVEVCLSVAFTAATRVTFSVTAGARWSALTLRRAIRVTRSFARGRALSAAEFS